MVTGPAREDLVTAIAQICRQELDPDALRESVLPLLRRAVPTDALWWALVDPATLLFTQTHREELPASSGPYFVGNEFLDHDVNRWTAVASDPTGVSTLMRTTGADPARSARYRDIFAPLGLQDELRAVMRVRGTTWGFLCLHRERAQSRFSPEEEQFVARVSAHIATGIRTALLRQQAEPAAAQAGPGLVLLTTNGEVIGTNSAADVWLEELGHSSRTAPLPVEVATLAALHHRRNPDDPPLPPMPVRTLAGRWVVLHASWVHARAETTMAVTIQPAAPRELAPLILTAFGLTERERTIAGLICQGLTTRQIANHLQLTTDTVQDHVKSIYVRTDVHSRGQLVATILRREYLPHAAAGTPLTSAGAFTPLSGQQA